MAASDPEKRTESEDNIAHSEPAMTTKEATPVVAATEVDGHATQEERSSSQLTRTEAEPVDHLRDIEAGEKSAAVETTKPQDPNIVDFDGPNDPLNAINWTGKQKWSMSALLSCMTLITPLASSMFAPGVPQVLTDFKSTDQLLGSFVVSVYVLGYAGGPLICAPMSELYGRVPVYHTTNVFFILWTIACALATNLNMLIGFRFLQGLAGSAVISMGAGTISDLFVPQERGRAMAIWSMGPLLGPVIGPIAGGFLTQAKGWRWVFWVLAIAAGFMAILFIFFVRESYAPVLLEHKAARLRKETGNPKLRSRLDRGLSSRQAFAEAIVRPIQMLVFSPIVLSMAIFLGVAYGYLYLLFTTISEVFLANYGFSQGVVGLSYIGIGVGMLSSLGIFGFVSDRLLKAQAAKHNGVLKPEYRLPPLIPGAALIPIGLFIYGWTAQYHVQWTAPIVGTAFVGAGLIATFMPVLTYLVDAFSIYAASAIAANTVIRSLVGALLPLAGPRMYAALGLGWGNSLLGFVALALVPVPLLFIKYGERIRLAGRYRPPEAVS